MQGMKMFCVPILAVVLINGGRAAEPREVAFHGVVAGRTSEDELKGNASWQPLIQTTDHEGGGRLLEYRFSLWKRILVLVDGGLVRLIDVTPPDRAPAAKLAEVLKLGELKPAARDQLPAGALAGPTAPADWQVLQAQGAARVLLFVEQEDGKPYVRRLRFYSDRPAYAGIAIQDLPSALASHFGTKPYAGVLVTTIYPATPAAEAKLLAGDIVLEFGGQAIEGGVQDFVRRTAAAPVGTAVPLTLLRAGARQRVNLTPRDRPAGYGQDRESHPAMPALAETASSERFGLTVATPVRSLPDALPGVVVTQVKPGGPADVAGLEAGAWVLRIGRTPIRTAQEFEQALDGQTLRPGMLLLMHHFVHRFLVLKEPEATLADLGRDIQLRPQDTAPLRSRARAYVRIGRLDQAIADYTDAIRLDPSEPQAYAGRAMVYYRKGDHDRSIADNTEAIRLRPKEHAYYVNRSQARLAKSDAEGAAADASEAIRLAPASARGYLRRAQADRRQKKYDSAIADLDRAIQLAPRMAQAYLVRGQCRHEQKDYDAAIQDFDEAARLDPQDSEPLHWRGHAYKLKGSLSLALKDLTDAIRLQPRDAGLRFDRATVYYQQGDYPAVIRDLDEALQFNPRLARGYWYRGAAHYKLGNDDQADRDRARSIDLDPSLADYPYSK